MAAVPFKFTTAASTNLQPVRAAQTANFKGFSAVVSAAYAVFLKLYWFTPTTAANGPTVGTTVPNATFMLGVTAGASSTSLSIPDGLTGNGELWVAVTKLVGDADSTVTVANDAVVTIFVE